MKMYAVGRPLSLCAVAAVVWMAGGLSANAAPVADTENTPVVAGHALPGKTVADRDDGRKREDFERRQDRKREDFERRQDRKQDQFDRRGDRKADKQDRKYDRRDGKYDRRDDRRYDGRHDRDRYDHRRDDRDHRRDGRYDKRRDDRRGYDPRDHPGPRPPPEERRPGHNGTA